MEQQTKQNPIITGVQLHAQPYDLSASSFYFHTADEFEAKAKKNVNDYGEPVEEYELQFIDGDDIDCGVASAWGINQANFAAYFDAVDGWDDHQKLHYIIAVGECGYCHEQVACNPDDIDICLYQISSMNALAEHFVDEGFFGEIPSHLQSYIDYDAIARDLAVDYSQVTICGKTYIYRCS